MRAPQNHVFMVIGSAEALPPPPTQKIAFSEDMTDGELAEAVRPAPVSVGLSDGRAQTKTPAGLQNLGVRVLAPTSGSR